MIKFQNEDWLVWEISKTEPVPAWFDETKTCPTIVRFTHLAAAKSKRRRSPGFGGICEVRLFYRHRV